LSTISIAVAALILGKAVLIADMLPAINRYPDKPLAYNVAWKTAIYWLMATLIHYVERLIDFSRQAGGIITDNQKLLAEIVWSHFWAVQILIARHASWRASSAGRKCCDYSSDQRRYRHFERE